jgi:hypothetical protein
MRRLLLLGLYLLALAGVLQAGCAARYQAPPRSESSVAYLEAVAPAWVAAIDGGKTAFFTPKSGKRYRLVPGPHVVEARYEALELRYVTARSSQIRGEIAPVAVSDVPLSLDQPLVTWNSALAETVVPVRSKRGVLLSFTAEAGRSYYLHDGRRDDDWKPFIDEAREPQFIEFDLRELGIQPGN